MSIECSSFAPPLSNDRYIIGPKPFIQSHRPQTLLFLSHRMPHLDGGNLILIAVRPGHD